MANWLSTRLEEQGKTKERFCDAVIIEDKTFKRWDNANVAVATINKNIEKIAKFFNEGKDTLLKGYWDTKREKLPKYLQYLAQSIEALEGHKQFTQQLYGNLSVNNVITLVQNTEAEISKTSKKAIQFLNQNYAIAIDDLVTETNNINDLNNVVNLIYCLALTCADEHPDYSHERVYSIKVGSYADDKTQVQHAIWGLEMMINRQNAIPIQGLVIKDGRVLMASGSIELTHLGTDPKSDSELGLNKELHTWVEAVAKKISPDLIVPPLSKADEKELENSSFWRYRIELQQRLNARNMTRDHLFATVWDTVPSDLCDLVIRYFTDQEDENEIAVALNIYRLSEKEGQSPYRLDVGTFAFWIIDRLKKIEDKKKALEGIAENEQPQRQSKQQNPIGDKDMKQSNNTFNGGTHHHGDTKINTQNNYTYINDLKEVQKQLGQLDNVEQSLKDDVQELIEIDPSIDSPADRENQRKLWAKVKTGIDNLNATGKTVAALNKTVTTFNKAYEGAKTVYTDLGDKLGGAKEVIEEFMK